MVSEARDPLFMGRELCRLNRYRHQVEDVSLHVVSHLLPLTACLPCLC